MRRQLLRAALKWSNQFWVFWGGILVGGAALFSANAELSTRIYVASAIIGFYVLVVVGRYLYIYGQATGLRRLGVEGLSIRREAGLQFSLQELISNATDRITCIAYAPLRFDELLGLVRERIESTSRIRVRIVVPDPGHRHLMKEIAELSEAKGEEGSYFDHLRSSLVTYKDSWRQLGENDRTRFSLAVSSVLPTFTAVMADRNRIHVQLFAHGWSTDDRILLRLGPGPLLDLYADAIDVLDKSSRSIDSAEQFDDLLQSVRDLRS